MPTRAAVFHVNDLGGAALTTAGITQSFTTGGGMKLPPKSVFCVWGIVWTSLQTLSSFADNVGTNTWVVCTQFNRGGLAPSCAIVAGFITDTSYTSVTATFSGSVSGMHVSGVYYAGDVGGYPPPDATPVNTGTVGTATSNCQAAMTLTPSTGAGMMAFCVVGTTTNASGITQSTGWNQIDNAGNATLVDRIGTATWVNDGITAKPTNFGCASSGGGSVVSCFAAWQCGNPFDQPQSGIQTYRCMPAHMAHVR